MNEDQRVLEVSASDTLLVFMQPSCPDSKKVRDWLRAIDCTSENGRVVYANVHAGGKLLTTAFASSGKGCYPSFDAALYRAMNDKFGTVLPKVFRLSIGQQLDPLVYYTNHGTGLSEIRQI